MFHRLLILWTLALATLLAGALPAAAKCHLSLRDVSDVNWRGATGAGYGAFDGSSLAQSVTFTVQNQSSSCAFFVGVVSQSSRDPNGRVLKNGGATLRYQIYRDNTLGAVLRDTPEAGSNEVLSGFIANQQSLPMQFYLSIPPLQVVDPDHYDDKIELRVYEGTVAEPVLNDSQTLNFRAEVPMVGELSFNGGVFDNSARSTTLRFQPAQTGATGSVTLWARSNAGYILSAESQNGGVLRYTDPTVSDVIPYTLRVDGATVPLVQGQSYPVAARADATNASGWQHQFDFTLGTVDMQEPGEYRDVVTVTMTKY
jgi:spore coat protein U-like protein